MRTGSRAVENGSSTTKVFVIRGHDGTRSGPTPALLCVVTVQRRTNVGNSQEKTENVHKWIRLQFLVGRAETKVAHTRENQ